ncbi:MAG: hypothetical protein OXF02_01255 [Simkaniaceae bacterium]|nr:hypothetical protein [Simkaniaceae bacterium]
MVGPIESPTVVVIGRQPGNVAPVVNQPVVAPVVNQPVVAPVVNQPVVAPVVNQPVVAPVVNQPVVAPVVNQPLVAPVVNQPVVAPAVANHIAPAVVADNVVQKWSGEHKCGAIAMGTLVTDGLIGGGCIVGMTLGAAEIAEGMGAKVAVVDGVAGGVGGLGGLCIVGIAVATLACYLKGLNK